MIPYRDNPQRIYFISDAEKIVGRDRQTLRRWWNRNHFPKPTLVSNRLAWRAEDIEKWINLNIQEG